VSRASAWGRSRRCSACVITRAIGRTARRLEERVRRGQTNDPTGARHPQGRGGRRHRRPRRNDVVNHQDNPGSRAGPEGRAVPARLAGLARLGRPRVTAEEATAGQPCLARHRPGEEPGLVISPATAPGSRGWHPGDHVNHVAFDQDDHGSSQPGHRGPGVAVLEAGQELSGRTFVGQGGATVVEPGRRGHGRRRAQGTDASPAGRRTRSVAQRATAREEHGFDPTQG
jgi:hypothetical protein